MTYLEGQIELEKAYVAYWQTVILSGSFKERNVLDGNGRELTENEKLKDSLEILKNHIDRMFELTNKLPL